MARRYSSSLHLVNHTANLSKMARRAQKAASAGQRVAANLRALREARHLSQPQLSRLTGEAGRPIAATLLSKAEQLDRRIDADDLMVLAIALGTTPNRLLLPGDAGDDRVELLPGVAATAREAWLWAAGEEPLGIQVSQYGTGPGDGSEFRRSFIRENRPHGAEIGFFIEDLLSTGQRGAAIGQVGAALEALVKRGGVSAAMLHELVDLAAGAPDEQPPTAPRSGARR